MRTPFQRYVAANRCHLFYFTFVFFVLFCFPFSPSIFFCSIFVFLFSSVSFHPGRPPKYSSSSAGPELGCHPLLTPSSSHPASPAAERPEIGGIPLPVHPHSLPQPSPSSGDVSSRRGYPTFHFALEHNTLCNRLAPTPLLH